MSMYKYKIIKKDSGKYVFRLYPNNSNSQPIGVSGQSFNNKIECNKALELFKEIISDEEDVIALLKNGKVNEGGWRPYLEKDGIVLMKREIDLLLGEYECKDWAKEIKNNWDAKLRDDF